MDAVLVVACALAGLMAGAFLNVVIERVPDKLSVWPPVLACSCGAEQRGIGALVPVRSWFRHCPECDSRAPRRYAAVEAATALLFALAAREFGTSWLLAPFLLLFAMLLTVSVIDIMLLRIPDRIVLPTFLVSVPLIAAVSFHEGFGGQITGALVGAVVYFGVLLVPHLISPKGMGFGDVKLAAVMGLYLGWLAPTWGGSVYVILVALLLGSFLGVVLGLGVALVRRKRGAFPFGPALALSTVIVVLGASQILDHFYRVGA